MPRRRKSHKPGLCHRCEHRVEYIERKYISEDDEHIHTPRAECGDAKNSKYSCYMYRPVRPLRLNKDSKEDKRPQFGPTLMSSRSYALEIPEMELKLNKRTLYWEPK